MFKEELKFAVIAVFTLLNKYTVTSLLVGVDDTVRRVTAIEDLAVVFDITPAPAIAIVLPNVVGLNNANDAPDGHAARYLLREDELRYSDGS